MSELSRIKLSLKASRPPKQRKAIQKDERAGVFRKFLVDTYGAAALRCGSGVLDVAGGQGSLAFELLNIDEIPCTIIDPRSISKGFERLQRKWRVLGTQPMLDSSTTTDAFTAAAVAPNDRSHHHHSASSTEDETARARALASRRVRLDYNAAYQKRPACQMPRHWPIMFTANLLVGGEEVKEEEEGDEEDESLLQVRIDGLLSKAARMEWTRKGLVSSSSSSSPAAAADVEPNNNNDDTGVESAAEAHAKDGMAAAAATVLSAVEARTTLSGCSLICGMHPDGATESIVDFALAHGKPFAVVPCCIYYPTPPMSYQRFIKYLVAKAPPNVIRTCVLDFEGKNVCVYSLPTATQELQCLGTSEGIECGECT